MKHNLCRLLFPSLIFLWLLFPAPAAPDDAASRKGADPLAPPGSLQPLPPPSYKPLPAPAPPPAMKGSQGAINPQTGEYYPPSGAGVINPRTGEYYPPSGRGFINPKTGAVYPSR